MQRKEMREREEGGKRERDRERETEKERGRESECVHVRTSDTCVCERERQLNFLTQAACKRWILLLMTSDHDYIEIMHCNFTVPYPTDECGVLLVVAIFLR